MRHVVVPNLVLITQNTIRWIDWYNTKTHIRQLPDKQ